MIILKFIGIGLFSAVIFALGLAAGRAYNDRLRYLTAFAAMVTRLRGYIEFDRGELAELYPLCAGGDVAPLDDAGFLSDAAVLGWDEAIKKLAGQIFIDGETMAALTEFGGLLGKTCAEEQLRNCDRTTARLGEIIKIRTPEVAKKIKLCRALGASAAMMAVLLLL